MSHRFSPQFTVGALAALTAFALVTGCSSDSTEPDEIANVRIVNLSPANPTITANHEDHTVQAGVALMTSTLSGGCGTVERGSDEQIDFFTAGTSNGLGSVQYNFEAGKNYTVIFYGPSNAKVYPEVFNLPANGNNAIRFINATGTAGDVYLTQSSVTNVSGSPTVAALAAGAASGTSTSAPGGTFAEYSTANTRVRLFNVGQQTGTPRADFTFNVMPSNRVATIILTPAPSGSSTTAFMVGPCAS